MPENVRVRQRDDRLGDTGLAADRLDLALDELGDCHGILAVECWEQHAAWRLNRL
jgi:hypothetical protein